MQARTASSSIRAVIQALKAQRRRCEHAASAETLHSKKAVCGGLTGAGRPRRWARCSPALTWMRRGAGGANGNAFGVNSCAPVRGGIALTMGAERSMKCPTWPAQHAPVLEPRVGKHGDLSRAQSYCRAGAASGSRSPETAPCASRRGRMAEQSRCARHGLPAAQAQGVRVHRRSGGAASRSDSN